MRIEFEEAGRGIQIIKVNDKAVDRSPKVDVTGLKAEETTNIPI